jgi:hypothetical protein
VILVGIVIVMVGGVLLQGVDQTSKDVWGLVGKLGPALAAYLLVALSLFSAKITQVIEGRLHWVLNARKALRLLLSNGLVLVGMKLLYTENAAAAIGGQFDPVFQYVLWGLGADISAQALSQARG